MMSEQASSATSTAGLLVAAAMAEFNEHGFSGTDTNRIARRAGFAPQTFYRWFKDKIEIFVACYRAWEDEETEALQALFERDAPSAALVEAGVAHHRRYLMFRRSLRQLSLDHPVVRAARAESRLRLIGRIRAWSGRPELSLEVLSVRQFQFERLTDAVAEGEFADMGLTENAARAEIARLMDELRA